MPFLLMILLFAGDLPIETFRIENFRSNSPQLNGSLSHELIDVIQIGKDLHIMDRSYQIWSMDQSGKTSSVYAGRGQGPGELTPMVVSFYSYDEQIFVIHGTGTLSATFDARGKLLDTGKYKESVAFFAPAKSPIHLKVISKGQFDIPIFIQAKNLPGDLPLVMADDNDTIPIFKCHFAVSKEFGLIYTSTSLQQTIYFALFDLPDETLLDHGSIKMTDKRISMMGQKLMTERPRGMVLPVVLGCTSSPELGFVLTEHTVPESFRYLKILNPKTKNWTARKVILGKHTNLTHFTHLAGNRWMALSGTEVGFFNLIKDGISEN